MDSSTDPERSKTLPLQGQERGRYVLTGSLTVPSHPQLLKGATGSAGPSDEPSSSLAKSRPSVWANTRKIPFPRQRSISPASYNRSIRAHSTRSFAKCLYSGRNYEDLASWLDADEQHATITVTTQYHMALLHDLSPPSESVAISLELGSLKNLEAYPRPLKDTGQILFLRGLPPPNWISSIGGKYNIDPEFFLHHLDFFVTLPERAAFSFPGPRSSSANIIRLCVSTILSHGNSVLIHGNEALQRQRKLDEEMMSNYRRHFRQETDSGDSIVREFSTIDGQYSILEQYISICVSKNGEGWMTLIWLDGGNSLAKNGAGPWATHFRRSETKTTTLPVVQRHPKMTLRQTISERSQTSTNSHSATTYHNQTPILQSTDLLSYDFESFLNHQVTRRDPLYALSNVFQHAIASHAQVLNLLDTKLGAEMGLLAKEPGNDPFENVLFLKRVLDRHINYLKEGLQALRSTTLQCAFHDEEVMHESEITRAALIDDYEGVLEKVHDIRTRCTEGMGITMNRAVIAESRKAIEQAASLKRLTILASLFIPLSFATSLFGMNFREFGQGRVPIWIFPAVALPILLLTYLIYFVNIIAGCVICWRLVRRGCRRLRSPLSNEFSKDGFP